MARVTAEDQEESRDSGASKTEIHLPATSGSSKQESLLRRAERAIKETMTWSFPPDEEEEQLGGREMTKSSAETTSEDAKGNDPSIKNESSSGDPETKLSSDTSSDESSSSEEKTNDDDWYNRQIKESLKEAMERATGRGELDQEALKSAEEAMVKATSNLVDRIETAFSEMRTTIIQQFHPRPVRNLSFIIIS